MNFDIVKHNEKCNGCKQILELINYWNNKNSTCILFACSKNNNNFCNRLRCKNGLSYKKLYSLLQIITFNQNYNRNAAGFSIQKSCFTRVYKIASLRWNKLQHFPSAVPDSSGVKSDDL